ncbi:exotoxin translocation ATP-binding protein PaxB [Rhodobacteraceae bacterium KLH11]|nr:exotoxin translocation ATP-binding protein PaxB [Rhodobacteraceae bacterium KLH11]
MIRAEGEACLHSFTLCLRVCGALVNVPEETVLSCADMLAQTDRFNLKRVKRICSKFDIKLKSVGVSLSKLDKQVFPKIIRLKQGHYVVAAKVNSEERQVLIFDPIVQKPEVKTYAWLEENIQGKALNITFSGGVSLRGITVKWFAEAFLKYKALLAEILIASFLINLLALMIPLFFQVTIDKVVSNNAAVTLEVLAIVLFVGVALEAVLTGIRQYVMNHTTTRIDVVLGAKIYDHLIHLPISYFFARKVGESVARVREIDKIREFLTKASLALTVDLLFVFVFLWVMSVFSMTLTSIVLVSIPLYALIAISFTPILQDKIEQVFRAGANKETFLVEAVSGVETLKASAVEAATQRSWETRLAESVSSNFQAAIISAIMSNGFQLVAKMTTVVVLFVGAGQVIDGDLTIGQLIAFNMLLGQVNAPILKLAQLWQDYQRAKLSVDRLNDVIQTPMEVVSQSGYDITQLRGSLQFKSVSFAYDPNSDPIIKDLSLVIPAGQKVGIVGASGSGKSTLTKLVQKLFTPQRGKVLIDGLDLSDANPLSLRSQIGVVLQENLLFNRTIRENIALTDPSVPISKVIDAAKQAGAHDFILEMSEGYDTVVEEMGANMSGGQRQRIAIARALIGNPRILIFDEATSALDYESEEIIERNMSAICEGRTVLIVAHRLSAVARADRIITLEDGVIVEDGSHDELIVQQGRYAQLYNSQFGELRDAERS